MSVIAEFTIPPEALPGGSLLAEMPEIRIELERVIPTQEQAFPFFWVFGENVATFVRELEEEPEIAELTVLARLDHGAVVQAAWTPDAEVVHAIKTLKATILEATGSAENWRFRIRATSHEKVKTFSEIFQEHDIPVYLERIQDLSSERVTSQYALTPEQQEILVAAYEAGYFQKPRGTTQAELGEEFDITARAVSDRLRRGTRNLIANTSLTAATSPRD